MSMDSKGHDTAAIADALEIVALELKKEKRKAELMYELNELVGAPVQIRKQLALEGLAPESAWCDEFGYVTSRAYVTPEFRERQRACDWWATYRAVLAVLVDRPREFDARTIARDEANYAHGTVDAAAHMNVGKAKP